MEAAVFPERRCCPGERGLEVAAVDVAWNEGVSSESRVVTVTDGGSTETDFTLR